MRRPTSDLAIQQIVTTIRAVSGANFAFEWNPTLGDTGIGDLANFYPGNAYVNYIGSDVYDVSGALPRQARPRCTTMGDRDLRA